MAAIMRSWMYSTLTKLAGKVMGMVIIPPKPVTNPAVPAFTICQLIISEIAASMSFLEFFRYCSASSTDEEKTIFLLFA